MRLQLERIVALRNQADYDRAFAVVRSAIKAWDPYGLVSGGAPPDEWDLEVAKIVAQIPRIASAKDAALAVARTFTSALEQEGFSPEDCEGVGAQLYSRLVGAKILDPT